MHVAELFVQWTGLYMPAVTSGDVRRHQEVENDPGSAKLAVKQIRKSCAKKEKKMHWNFNRTESIQTWKCCELSSIYSEQRKKKGSKIKGRNWLWMDKDGRWLISITSNVTDGSVFFFFLILLPSNWYIQHTDVTVHLWVSVSLVLEKERQTTLSVSLLKKTRAVTSTLERLSFLAPPPPSHHRPVRSESSGRRPQLKENHFPHKVSQSNLVQMPLKKKN